MALKLQLVINIDFNNIYCWIIWLLSQLKVSQTYSHKFKSTLSNNRSKMLLSNTKVLRTRSEELYLDLFRSTAFLTMEVLQVDVASLYLCTNFTQYSKSCIIKNNKGHLLTVQRQQKIWQMQQSSNAALLWTGEIQTELTFKTPARNFLATNSLNYKNKNK